MTRRGWALFAAMCVIWGIPYLLIKIAVGSLSPPALVFGRTVIGSAILVPVAAASGSLVPSLRRWKVLAVYTASRWPCRGSCFRTRSATFRARWPAF